MAVENETISLGKDALVSIGSAEEGHDRLPRLEQLAANLDVHRDSASRKLARAFIAHKLFDRPRCQLIVTQ